jgi:hypothetical protein
MNLYIPLAVAVLFLGLWIYDILKADYWSGYRPRGKK